MTVSTYVPVNQRVAYPFLPAGAHCCVADTVVQQPAVLVAAAAAAAVPANAASICCLTSHTVSAVEPAEMGYHATGQQQSMVGVECMYDHTSCGEHLTTLCHPLFVHGTCRLQQDEMHA